jgi:DNA-binding NarL/FixJ family response regulator
MRRCFDEPPDIVVVDLTLPDMNSRDVVRALRERLPELRVIVLAGEFSPSLPAELLSLGISGLVDKMSGFAEMESAVHHVLANGFYFSAGMAPTSAANGCFRPARNGPPLAVLTEREREIARLVANGLISKEIAPLLQLSPRTVEKARAQIQAKLGVNDLPSLVRWCVQHELV